MYDNSPSIISSTVKRSVTKHILALRCLTPIRENPRMIAVRLFRRIPVSSQPSNGFRTPDFTRHPSCKWNPKGPAGLLSSVPACIQAILSHRRKPLYLPGIGEGYQTCNGWVVRSGNDHRICCIESLWARRIIALGYPYLSIPVLCNCIYDICFIEVFLVPYNRTLVYASLNLS